MKPKRGDLIEVRRTKNHAVAAWNASTNVYVALSYSSEAAFVLNEARYTQLFGSVLEVFHSRLGHIFMEPHGVERIVPT